MTFFAGFDRFELAALFGASLWLLISVLFQTRRVGLVTFLKRFDYFAMIPAWSFFAPNPGTMDIHLVYRDCLVDGNVTCWTEVRWETRPWRFLWNPHKRLQKGISDLSKDVQECAVRNLKSAERLLTYPAFIALLNFVSRRPHAPFAELTQFCIAFSYGPNSAEPTKVTFLSNFHRLA